MAIQEVIDRVRNDGRNRLTLLEAGGLLSQMEINVIDTRLAASREEATAISRAMGFPVVLKTASPDVLHKSDAGGVRLNLQTMEQVGKAYDEITACIGKAYPAVGIQGVYVQPAARSGVEVIVGISRDARFGPVLMFGLGGILVEILKDVSFRIVPLERHDAAEMIREIKGYPLLEGYRGQEPVDISILEEVIMKVSELADTYRQIKELDLNPLFSYGDGAVVVDARVVLADES